MSVRRPHAPVRSRRVAPLLACAASLFPPLAAARTAGADGGAEPPPSFTEYRSACGSALVLPGGSTSFPDLDLPNRPAYGQGEDPPTGDPPSDTMCVCY